VLIATNRGYDTDCTAASAAALCGALSGSKTIPKGWVVTLDAGNASNPYTNAHFTNKATADGLYRALQNKVRRMEAELIELKADGAGALRGRIDKFDKYIKLMKKHKVIK